MNTTIRDNIPFRINIDSLLKKLRVEKNSEYAANLLALVSYAQNVARPKALYKTVFLEAKQDDQVIIDGMTLKSRVLMVNLEKVHRVFAFVATCGTELEDWARSFDDLLKRFWSEAILMTALRSATKYLNNHIDEHFRPGLISTMTPGSLEDWPIEEQRKLFTILGDTREAIGVRLTESLLMIPTKSVSGILFPTEVSFESCQLCPREKCQGRRAPYDKDLYEKKYDRRDD